MHHTRGLRRELIKQNGDESKADSLVGQLERDPTDVELSAEDRQMLRYVIKLTNSPGSVEANDVQQLREAGFDDRAIHDICCITSYFAFVNRVADGLGVELESDAQ